MLEIIKTLLQIDDSKDELLIALLDTTIAEVKTYCRIDDVSELESAIIQMVIYKYNRLGTEGIASESYSGVNFNYADYPTCIQNMLKIKRRLKLV